MRHWMRTAALGMAASLTLGMMPFAALAADRPETSAAEQAAALEAIQYTERTMPEAAGRADEDMEAVGLELITENVLHHIENALDLGEELSEDLQTAIGLLSTEDPLGVTWERVVALNALGFLNKVFGTVQNGTFELPDGTAGHVTWDEADTLGILSDGQIVLPFDTAGIVVLDPENTYVQPGQYCIIWDGDKALRLLEIVGVQSGPEFVEGSAADLLSKFHALDIREIEDEFYCVGAALRSYGDVRVGDLEKYLESYGFTDVTVLNADGSAAGAQERLATGQTLQIGDETGEMLEIPIVVAGDVLGSGELSVSQLARLAKALNGSAPLSGAFALAGDVDGSGKTSISDLVLLARMLTR